MGRSAQLVPTRFISANKLTRDDKLLSAFEALVLSELLDREVHMGKIVHGDHHVAGVAPSGETEKMDNKAGQ